MHSLWSHLGALPTLGGVAVGLAGWPVQWSAVSEAAAAPVRRALGAEVPVLVLPNAVDPSRWQVPHRAAVASPVPTIFSVMRFARTKRPLALVRMLREVRAQLPDDAPLRAVLIGDGPQRPPVERYLERHGMRDWVELPGRLSRAEIREAYADAGLYVAPAERESFGIAALEARCAGLPVVASSRGGVGSFVTPGVNGWLADDDAGMVRAMVRLLTDRAGAAVIEATQPGGPAGPGLAGGLRAGARRLRPGRPDRRRRAAGPAARRGRPVSGGVRRTVVSFHAHPDDEALLTGGHPRPAGRRGPPGGARRRDRGEARAGGSVTAHGATWRAPARRAARLRRRARRGPGRGARVRRLRAARRTRPTRRRRSPTPTSQVPAERPRRLARLLREERADVLTIYDAATAATATPTTCRCTGSAAGRPSWPARRWCSRRPSTAGCCCG